MIVLKCFLFGFLLLLLQSSLVWSSVGIDIVPNLILTYLVTFSLYSGYGPVPLILFYGLFGSLLDSLSSGDRIVDGVIFPVLALVIVLLKRKFLISNIFVKTLIFLILNILYVLLKGLFLHYYTGYVGIFGFELYYVMLNLTVFYIFFGLRETLYGKGLEV